MNKLIMSVAGIGLLSVSAAASVIPSPMISDGMVLKQNGDARIWGTASPGERVTVTPSWNNVDYDARTDSKGNWSVSVRTPSGSFTPYQLKIEGKNSATVIKDVLVGEVWLASGQSNMQMPLKGFPGCIVKNGFKEVVRSSDYSNKVHFYCVPASQSYEPLENVDAHWSVPSPETAPDYSAIAWYFGTQLSDVLNVPVGMVVAAYGGSKVESWLPKEILDNYPDVSLKKEDMDKMTSYWRPMLMYNAMFRPVRRYSYNGIIWYQGCSNVSSPETYSDRLVTMVGHWRQEIGEGDIPFYAVEIAPYEYGEDNEKGKSPYLRLAQWDAVSRLANADMICTNDAVEPYERYNIHPGDKETVGRRLCDLALNRTYGKKQFLAGSPKYKGYRLDGDKIIIAVDSPNMGICRNYDVKGFEIAGEDGVFYPVTDVVFLWQTNEFQLRHPDVPAPKAARYGFRDFMPGTVYGGNHLPLIPFRTYSK